MLIPLDMHAHIEPSISPVELDRLGACIVAVTRSIAEYADVAQRRRDRSVVWGVGCHPGLARALRSFSRDSFRAALASAAVIGEVGLDGTGKVPLATQQSVFEDVLGALVETPRIVSVHSYRATTQVLDTIERHRSRGVILHWWLGNEQETSRAISLGAYFSVNASQAVKWPTLRAVPRDRLLTETDHPFGDRRETLPRQPGNIGMVERRLGEIIGLSTEDVRRLAWQNLGRLVDQLQLHEFLPHDFQVQLLAA